MRERLVAASTFCVFRFHYFTVESTELVLTASGVVSLDGLVCVLRLWFLGPWLVSDLSSTFCREVEHGLGLVFRLSATYVAERTVFILLRAAFTAVGFGQPWHTD